MTSPANIADLGSFGVILQDLNDEISQMISLSLLSRSLKVACRLDSSSNPKSALLSAHFLVPHTISLSNVLTKIGFFVIVGALKL